MSSLLRALFTGTSKHKKLSEEWATLREPVVEGVTFYCKYLGSTMVDDPKGEAATAEAIKRIIHTAKQVARKPERVALHVSLKGIRMEDGMTKEVLLQTSIYKISYCSADAHYDHVFAFIATTDNETCECHAFLCPKRKMAQAVTISIAQAFNLAYECWKMSLENKENQETFGHEELPAEVTVSSAPVHGVTRSSLSQPSSQASSPIPIHSDFGSSDMSTSGYQSSNQALLIDLEDSLDHTTTTTTTTTTTSQGHTKTTALSKPLNTLDDQADISDGFSSLALRRDTPRHPLPGMSRVGLAELGLAAFTAHPAASQTVSGCWPSTSPPHAACPLATSPPDPQGALGQSPPDPWAALGQSPPDPWAALGQSPPDAWEMFSRSPNSAFLHSCQSPPSPSMFLPLNSVQSPTSVHQIQSISQSVQSGQSVMPSFSQSVQSPNSIQPISQSVQSGQSVIPSFSQSVQSPHPVQSIVPPPPSPESVQSPTHAHHSPFPSPSDPSDPFSGSVTQWSNGHLPPALPVSPTCPHGRQNPFFPPPTNPFVSPHTPGREEGSRGDSQSTPTMESPRVVLVAPGGGGGCGPSRPTWTPDLFSGTKNKDVACS